MVILLCSSVAIQEIIAYGFKIANQMKEKFQMLLFDNQGIGQTKDKEKPLSVEIMADDVIELADSLKLQNPILWGSPWAEQLFKASVRAMGKKWESSPFWHRLQSGATR